MKLVTEGQECFLIDARLEGFFARVMLNTYTTRGDWGGRGCIAFHQDTLYIVWNGGRVGYPVGGAVEGGRVLFEPRLLFGAVPLLGGGWEGVKGGCADDENGYGGGCYGLGRGGGCIGERIGGWV